MASTILAAVSLFAATNIDEIVILAAFFLASTRGSIRGWQIILGQYLGFGALVALSVAAATGLTVIPDEWVGFVGLVPLAIGVFGLVRWWRNRRSRDTGDEDDSDGLSVKGALGVAGVTFALGADNIALYTPFFRTISPAETVVTVVVFLVLVAVWCLVGKVVGTHPGVTKVLERAQQWLVPIVFIALGLFTLIESGVVPRLIGVLT